MSKYKVFAAAAVILAFAWAALPTGRAAAHHPTVLQRFNYELVETVEQGEMWADGAGLHIRNRVEVGQISGDMQATAYVVYNADLEFNPRGGAPDMPAPGTGTAFGTIEIYENSFEQLAPSWTGNWSYQLQDGKVVSGSMEAANPEKTLILMVLKVSQNRDGSIGHLFIIDHLYCPDVDCGVGPPLS